MDLAMIFDNLGLVLIGVVWMTIHAVLLIVVAKGYEGGAQAAASDIGPRLGLDYRITSLGHIQRGASPSAIDRIYGGELGSAAVDALVAGRSGLMVGMRSESVVETPFEDPWTTRHEVPHQLLTLLQQLA